jgi:hypothetical protein
MAAHPCKVEKSTNAVDQSNEMYLLNDICCTQRELACCGISESNNDKLCNILSGIDLLNKLPHNVHTNRAFSSEKKERNLCYFNASCNQAKENYNL